MVAQNQRDSQATDQQRYYQYLAPRFWPTWLLLLLLQVLAYVPFYLQMRLGQGLGWLAYWLLSARRQVVLTNLRLCFAHMSQAQRIQLAKATFSANTIGLIETATVWCRGAQPYAKRTQIYGQQHIEQALAQQQGVLLVGGHFAILDLAGALAAWFGVPFDIVYRKHNNPLFNLFMTRSRERFYPCSIARKDIKTLLRRLRQGHAVWYPPDHDYGRKNSLFVPFFNCEAACLTATSRLPRITGAQVVPTVFYRNADLSGYAIHYDPPLAIPSDSIEQDIRLFNAWLEDKIKARPEQYMWLHRRFKTRPEGEPCPYQKGRVS